MNKNLQKFPLILALLPAWTSAQSFTVQSLELDISNVNTLPADEPMYARLSYQSEIPLRFELTGWADGKRLAPSYAEPPALYPAGSGDAVMRIAFHDKTVINEFRIALSDQSSRTLYSISMPVELRWSIDQVHRPNPAEWARKPGIRQAEPIAVSAGSPSIQILEFDPPPGEVTLSPGEPMYIRLVYRSDMPLRFRPTAFQNGEKLNPEPSFSNPVFDPATHVHPAGYREAITWFIYHGETGISELQLAVQDEHGQTLKVIPVPVKMNWSGRTYRKWRNPAEWVRALLSAQHGISPDSPREQPQEDRAFAYSKWMFWVLQPAVVLLGVLLARRLESVPMMSHGRRTAPRRRVRAGRARAASRKPGAVARASNSAAVARRRQSGTGVTRPVKTVHKRALQGSRR
jgi:hypothetical protein